MVKNLPAMPKTWVQTPGQKDPLEKGVDTLSSILAWKIPIHGVAKESDMTGQLNKNKSSNADITAFV